MLLLLHLILLSTPGEPAPRVFDISVATPEGAQYVSGRPIPLRCTFKNVTLSKQTFLLPERNSGAPLFMRARVWDEEGHLLTKNHTLPDGWWTVHVLKSSMYEEAKGDRVSVEAGRELMVDVDLAVILRGCPSLSGPLQPGRYQVQLDSEVGQSNELPVEVR